MGFYLFLQGLAASEELLQKYSPSVFAYQLYQFMVWPSKLKLKDNVLSEETEYNSNMKKVYTYFSMIPKND